MKNKKQGIFGKAKFETLKKHVLSYIRKTENVFVCLKMCACGGSRDCTCRILFHMNL